MFIETAITIGVGIDDRFDHLWMDDFGRQTEHLQETFELVKGHESVIVRVHVLEELKFPRVLSMLCYIPHVDTRRTSHWKENCVGFVYSLH